VGIADSLAAPLLPRGGFLNGDFDPCVLNYQQVQSWRTVEGNLQMPRSGQLNFILMPPLSGGWSSRKCNIGCSGPEPADAELDDLTLEPAPAINWIACFCQCHSGSPPGTEAARSPLMHYKDFPGVSSVVVGWYFRSSHRTSNIKHQTAALQPASLWATTCPGHYESRSFGPHTRIGQ
jgi:hypothetical protein